MKTLFALMLAAQPAADQTYDFKSKEVIVRNATTSRGVEDPKSGDMQLHAEGHPVVAELLQQGTVITGERIDATLAAQPDGSKKLRFADVSGNAKLDTTTTEVGRTAAEGSSAQMHLESETMHLDAISNPDVFTLAHPFTYDETRIGSEGAENGTTAAAAFRTPVKQVSHITGSSGLMTFEPQEAVHQTELRTADIPGPVHYHLVKTENPAGKSAIVTNYDLLADHVTLDFTHPIGKIVAKGHVRWTQDGINPYSVTGTEVDVTTDAQRNPQAVDFSGSPSTTSIDLTKFGGGL
jgi:hypothetical protein